MGLHSDVKTYLVQEGLAALPVLDGKTDGRRVAFLGSDRVRMTTVQKVLRGVPCDSSQM